MQDVTDRFLIFYNYLLDKKIIKNASDFTKKLGIASSVMTEINKRRTEVGLKVLQGTVREFAHLVNANWLLSGTGDMIPRKELASPDSFLLDLCAEKDKTIAALEYTITVQSKLIEQLEQQTQQ
ncbi:hypothetical protein [Filimonas effusa]|uniref:Uncharacterized protein n=1 Tax=Filimonas effusa TaxID=2508721 RepID=A0A4Q1D187_9BACT|nr:hypothetical protein [Filimonas effusa]RXK81462.1 hypothetical protein ESB13_21265 [Filimonas effusa]